MTKINININELSELKDTLENYFFEGDGQVFCPFSEARPKKPGQKIRRLLEEAGLTFASDGVILEEAAYVFTVAQPTYGWITIKIDYWTCEVEFS